MISKNKIASLKELFDKKGRDRQGLFITEGIKMFAELTENGYTLCEIFSTEETLTKTPDIKKYNYTVVSENELSRISALKTPQGILATVHIPADSYDIDTSKIILALDSVQNPGNLGTIIRLADWFGITDIICSDDCADIYNPKVVQASMGALFRVKLHYGDLYETISRIKQKGIPIYGTFLEGEDIYKEKLNENAVIILGNEGKGISSKISELVDKQITIPNFSTGRGRSESLNVGIAAAIICSEFSRQM